WVKRGVGREVELALIADNQGAVVHQQLTHQAQHHDAHQNEKAVITALDLAEASQLLQRYGIQLDQHGPVATCQLKRMRGSTSATRISEMMLPISNSRLASSTTPMTTG